MTGAGVALACVLGAVAAPHAWDLFGWAAQAVFTWRMLHQWALSEREGRSVLPLAFWGWSLVGSALDLVYLLPHRRDPVFVSSAIVTTCIFARNYWMARRPRPATHDARPISWPIVLGLLLFAGVTLATTVLDERLLRFDRGVAWLVIGFLGSVGWTGRFVVQWWASERRGVSHLPPAFFRIGFFSAVLLTLYAVSQWDWVKMFAFAVTTVPYGRNLILLRRAKSAAP